MARSSCVQRGELEELDVGFIKCLSVFHQSLGPKILLLRLSAILFFFVVLRRPIFSNHFVSYVLVVFQIKISCYNYIL